MSERNISIDLLRILACIAVIMVHTVGVPVAYDRVPFESLDYYICMVWSGCIRWAVPVFVMITGYFMLDPQKTVTTKSIFSKRLPRIVCALIFWSMAYAAVLHCPIYPFGSQEAHFWYLGMLIGLYLAIPILRHIAARIDLLEYFLLAWLAIETYKFTCNFITKPFSTQPTIFATYGGYCLLGYYIRWLATQHSKKYACLRRMIYILGIIGTIITGIGGAINIDIDEYISGYASPNVIFCSAAILLFFAMHPITLASKHQKIVKHISGCTFGIYLVHLLILIETYNRFHRIITSTVPHLLVTIAFAFCAGYVITLILKQIPVINKYIV